MASRLLSDAHGELVRRFGLVAQDYAAQMKPYRLVVTCTYRSPEEQAELYKQGRSLPGRIVTRLDGFNSRSKHNTLPSRALDVCVVGPTVDPRADSKETVNWQTTLYQPLVGLCEKHGLISGGNWKGMRDYPHIELPEDVV